jgi:hypothetical protein
MCNGAPFATGNWTNFWEVSAPGSELQVVMNAGHLQFADVAGAWDGVCCTGCTNLLAKEVRGGRQQGVCVWAFALGFWRCV